MRIIPRHERHEQREADIAKVVQIIETTGERQHIEAGGIALPGEAAVLRCIPICTRGVTALIPGTDPLAAIIAKETRLERLRIRR